jgi:hypothetical protein
MVYVKNDHVPLVVVNDVAHSILASACSPVSFEGTSQGGPDHTRTLDQRATYEFPGSKRGGIGETVAESATGFWSQAKRIRGGDVFVRRHDSHVVCGVP